jgi:hypothetical protein
MKSIKEVLIQMHDMCLDMIRKCECSYERNQVLQGAMKDLEIATQLLSSAPVWRKMTEHLPIGDKGIDDIVILDTFNNLIRQVPYIAAATKINDNSDSYSIETFDSKHYLAHYYIPLSDLLALPKEQ